MLYQKVLQDLYRITMDLNQSKLTKTEWESTEIPVHRDEKEILNLIIKGYHDVNMIYNKNESMINFLRLDPNVNVMNHLYKEYFELRLRRRPSSHQRYLLGIVLEFF